MGVAQNLRARVPFSLWFHLPRCHVVHVFEPQPDKCVCVCARVSLFVSMCVSKVRSSDPHCHLPCLGLMNQLGSEHIAFSVYQYFAPTAESYWGLCPDRLHQGWFFRTFGFRGFRGCWGYHVFLVYHVFLFGWACWCNQCLVRKGRLLGF